MILLFLYHITLPTFLPTLSKLQPTVYGHDHVWKQEQVGQPSSSTLMHGLLEEVRKTREADFRYLLLIVLLPLLTKR